jgi:hypothetical protein
MESIEISSVSDSSDAVDLSSDVSFADSTVTYESGEFHRIKLLQLPNLPIK